MALRGERLDVDGVQARGEDKVPLIACRACGKPSQADKRFCVECGSGLKLACPSCGAPLQTAEKFCGSCGAKVGPPPEPAPRKGERTEQRPTEGERRQLTVLFSDLVGSTELSARIDPEEYHEILHAYHEAVSRAIARFDGYLAQYLGDGVLAYFGWPRAHGDDPERAVRAGLELLTAVGRINSDLPELKRFAVRVGIHTGPVVVGEVGDGRHREMTALGETLNVAARVQAAAPAQGVAITAATGQLVAGLFVMESLGVQKLKGLVQPLELHVVREPARVSNRLYAAKALTPFIGREQELRALGERWKMVERGEGQVVMLHGEAGIGKSRLMRQFRERLGSVPHAWMEASCSPFEVNTPFAPTLSFLREALAWRDGDPAEERLADLEKALSRAGLKLTEAVPLLAELLDLPVPEQYPPLLSPPEQKRRRLIATLAQWTFAIARGRPTVALLEDIHNADPSTLDLHQLLIEQCETVPLMMVYTARPEFVAPWRPRSHYVRLTLGRLSQRQTRELAQRVAATLTDRKLALVVERTGGVPLFVEELARVVADANGSGRSEQKIPVTLADSLMARLDRLGETKEIAQIASVMGREFSYAMLAEVAGRPEPELRDGLEKLAQAEIIYPRGFPPEATYLFKHVLVCDTAYDSMLKSRRRELHRAVANAFREKFPQRAEAEPETLAYHLTEANETVAAVGAWKRAGDRSAARGALVEASHHYSKALEVLSQTSESPARDEREMPLLIALGSVVSATESLASSEAERVYRRARELGTRLGHSNSPALLGLWQTCLCRGEIAAALALAEQRLKIAQSQDAQLALCWANYAVGVTQLHGGKIGESLKSLRASVEQFLVADSASRPFDAGPLAMSYLAVSLALSGLAGEARAMAAWALETANRLGKPSNIAFSSINVAAMHQLLNEPNAALRVAREGAALAHRNGLKQLACGLDVYVGWALAALGNARAGLEQIRRGIAGWQVSGMRLPRAWYLSLLAWAYALEGNFEEAEQTLADAAAAIGELLMEKPIVAWTRAHVLRMSGADDDRLEAAWREAIESARGCEMKLYELRSALGLAQLLSSRGRPAEARELLAPILAPLTQGSETPDIVEGRHLLEQLGD